MKLFSSRLRGIQQFLRAIKMEKRVAVISIVVRDRAVSHKINDILSVHGDVIRGRLGFPYSERGVSIIIILIDAEQSTIGAISGAIGNLPGVTLRSTMLL